MEPERLLIQALKGGNGVAWVRIMRLHSGSFVREEGVRRPCRGDVLCLC